MSLLSLLLLTAAPVASVPAPPTVKSQLIVPLPRVPPPWPICDRDCISPVEAVTYASYLAPKAGVAGTFRMQVKAVGQQGGYYYLNSEADYRDRNCLTIAIPAKLMGELVGDDLAAAERWYKNRTILVRGVAARVRIDFLDDDGKPTDKYYYQVQVRIGHADQIATRTGYSDDRSLQQ